MAGRLYSAKEDRYIRRHYGQRPAAEIAEALGRDKVSVYRRAHRLGLTEQRDPKVFAARRKKVIRLHAQQMSDAEIAERIGISRRAVGEYRERLELPANGDCERRRKRVAAKTRQQCRAAGVKNLAQVRAERYKQFVRELGWPDHLTVRAAQIAETLYRHGPMTREQIAEAIGVPWKGSRKTFNSNRSKGGSYMSELQHAGIVVRLRRAVPGKSRGASCDLYMVALEVEPCRVKTTA